MEVHKEAMEVQEEAVHNTQLRSFSLRDHY